MSCLLYGSQEALVASNILAQGAGRICHDALDFRLPGLQKQAIGLNPQTRCLPHELNLPAKRVNVNLNNQKFQKESKTIMKGVKEGLLSMYENKKN